MDLAVEIAGIRFKNPFWLAPGMIPDGKHLRKAAEAGAGAVVTKTILEEKFVTPKCGRVWLVKANKDQYLPLHACEGYSDIPLSRWLETEFEEAAKGGSPVVASIPGYYPNIEKTIRMAKAVSNSPHVDVIELNVSCPIEFGEGRILATIEQNPAALEEVTSAVKKASSVPVIVKLGLECNKTMAAQAAERGGADAISGINNPWALYSIDVETGKMQCPTPGGVMGTMIRPLAQGAVYEICQAVKIPVCGIGGIMDWEHAVQYIMLGATSTQSCTGVILKGFDFFRALIRGTERFLDRKGIKSILEVKGTARLISFDEQVAKPKITAEVNQSLCNGCGVCIKTCFYDAIELINGLAVIDPDKCDGCRVCRITCPLGAIIFED